MSRAGKFIPGGASSNRPPSDAAGGRTGPIRAPAATPGGTPDPASAKKTPGKVNSLIKPVSKGQKLPIIIMSGFVCCLLVSVAWYELAVVPARLKADLAEKQLKEAQAAQAKAEELYKQQLAELAKPHEVVRATLTVDSKPTGASITVGDIHKQTPFSATDLTPGTFTVLIHAEGYQDFKQDVTVTSEKPTDMGTVELVFKSGSISLTSDQTGVTYVLTGPNDYTHTGTIPDKLEKLPPGDYQLTATQRNWKLPAETISIHDQESVQKEVKFPYAQATIISTPPGATVRQGRTVLGQTPLTLAPLQPGDMNLSVDLVPFTIQRFTLHIADFGNVTRQVTFQPDRNFVASCGMPMVWIPEGHFWAGKYEVRQSDYEEVMGSNPSTFRRSTRPVETISWGDAVAFCDKLTQFELKAGKLPPGYHYSLPTESQWSLISADASLETAPMSRTGNSYTSTLDVGASEPNKYGIYDTLGNVWEWCLDKFDEKGNHSLRGGSWLSSSENFPNADTRIGGTPKYADRFTGFRVVLVQ